MRIGIVEDNDVTRETLRLLLSGEPSIGSVSAFESAEEMLQSIRPRTGAPFEAVLVDLDLPGMHGTELIQNVKERFPETEVIVYTIFEDRETVFSAIKAGASGYILKGSSPRELLDSLHTVRQGGAPMTPKIARKVLQAFQGEPGSGEIENPLSAKEAVIVRLIGQGLSYKEISDELNISPHTVHTHIKNIYDKLHAENRKDALRRARKIGII